MYEISLLNMNIYLSFFPDERELCIFITTGCKKKWVLDFWLRQELNVSRSCASVIFCKRTLKTSSSSILKSPGGF